MKLNLRYDVELLQRIEASIHQKLDEYKTEASAVLVLSERVSEALNIAKEKMKDVFKRNINRGKTEWREKEVENLLTTRNQSTTRTNFDIFLSFFIWNNLSFLGYILYTCFGILDSRFAYILYKTEIKKSF